MARTGVDEADAARDGGSVELVLADERAGVRARVQPPDEVLPGRVAEQRAQEQVHVAQTLVQLAPDAHAALDAAHQRQVPEHRCTQRDQTTTSID